MSIKIVMKEEVPRNAVFVTGFQGIGITGYIAVRHMVAALNAKPIGFVLLKRMPPFVWMDGNRLATPIQLFKHGSHVFMLVEFMPSPSELYRFINRICNWCATNFSEALLMGGLDLRVKKDGEVEKAKFAATSQAISKVLDKGYKVLDTGLYVTGPLALMLMKFEQLGFPAIAILSYANPSRPDPMAAAVAIEYFSKMYDVKVETDELIKDAQRIEAEIEENLKRKQEKIKSEATTLYI
ncbi:MAG: PAC2 family protein [Thermoproteota archaeon]